MEPPLSSAARPSAIAPPRIGTAGWTIPRDCAAALPGEGSHLERYARLFDAAEINSSFHRPHRPATYARWAAAVPPNFRFSVKLPKTITHQRKLADCGDLLLRFADESVALGPARGPTLVQLPPKLAFDRGVAGAFFADATRTLGAAIVCEPRHPSWFVIDADSFLADNGIARVAADPAICPEAARPGGWPGLAYFRLHGSPVIYRSPYAGEALDRHGAAVRRLSEAGVPCWIIFDNTASGAATGDALALRDSWQADA